MSNMARIRLEESTALSRPAIVTRPAISIPRGRFHTRDNFMTFDSQLTVDSTGAFLIGELERLDMTLHEPLAAVTWGRDIDLREDVTMADEQSSFTLSSFAAAGGINPAGKNWISKDATAISGISLDIGKTLNNLYPWGMELKYTLLELASAEKIGRPVDSQKYNGMKLKHQMDIDEEVYIGDSFYGTTGLLNSAAVTATNVVNGGTGSPLWINKTPTEILADVNTLLNSVWASSGWAIVPDELRLPPTQFSYINSQLISTAGSQSILSFLRDNSLCNTANGRPLNIQPVKWLTGRGVGSTNRMLAYTRDKDRVRFPMVPLARTPIQFDGIYQKSYYYGRLGVTEIVYPETCGYSDGI
jgi:hypothetical protein